MHRPPRDRFEALVREHHAAVYRSAARWLGDDGAADVTQDVFVRVLEGKVRLDAAQSERATLCWLATRLGANARRSRLRRSRHEETAMHTVPTPAADHEDPARRAADRDLQRTVAEAVRSLPDDLRLPLQMHCQDELTFAAIGTALRVPTSTAHDRVQQALQRLRTNLAGRGLALAAAQLPDAVARLDAAAPTGLEGRLLSLGSTASTTVVAGTGARLTLAAVACAATAVVAWVAWWPERVAVAPPVATVGVAAAADAGERSVSTGPGTDRVAVSSAPAPRAVEPPSEVPTIGGSLDLRTSSTYHGSVRDVAAWPVPGVTVHAVAAGGLKADELGSTTTDSRGQFRLELGPHSLHPDAVRLRVVDGSHVLLETDEYAMPRAAQAEALDLVLPAAAGTALSHFDLRVAVVDSDGLPVPAAEVVLFGTEQPFPRPDGPGREVEATTGGDGRALLHGRVPGAKWLFVDGRPLGRVSHFAPLDVPGVGAHDVRVVLPPGDRLEVQVGTFEGGRLEWANVWLEDEANGLLHSAPLGDDGIVRFDALGRGTYTLRVTASTEWSLVLRRGVRAGGPPLELRIKRRDDLRDVGDHQAELHGELVDAVTGETIAFGAFAVDVRPVRPGVSSLPSDRVQAPPIEQQLDFGGTSTTFQEVALHAGRWALVTDVPGYAPSVVEFELRDGEMRTGLRIPLHRGGEVRGRVVDAAGQPVPYARVFPIGTGELADRCLERWRALRDGAVDRLPDPSVPCTVAYSDADGRFALTGVPPGVTLRLVAHERERGAAVSAMRTVNAGEVQEGVELRFDER